MIEQEIGGISGENFSCSTWDAAAGCADFCDDSAGCQGLAVAETSTSEANESRRAVEGVGAASKAQVFRGGALGDGVVEGETS